MEQYKLAKCPMCGSVDAPVIGMALGHYHARCGDGTMIVLKKNVKGCGLMTRFYDTPQEAAAAWNRRDGEDD